MKSTYKRRGKLIFRILSTQDISSRHRLDTRYLLIKKQMAVVALKISLGLNLTDLKRPRDLFVKVIRRNTETKREMKCLKPIVSEESLD